MGQSGTIHPFNPRSLARRIRAARLPFRTPEIGANVRGPLLTLATVIAFDVLARLGMVIPMPFPVIILTIVYAAVQGGLGPASISALITTVYAFHFFSERVGLLLYDSTGIVALVSTAGAAWIAAFVVSRLTRREPAPMPRELTHDEADAIRRRLSLIEHTSTLLASSLDYEATIGRMTRLLVPTLADWCTVHLAGESGELRFVAGAHRDVSREMMVRALAEHEGRPLFGVPGMAPDIVQVDVRSIEARAGTSEAHELYRALAPRAAVRVPIALRGAVGGVLTLVLSQRERKIRSDDVELAGELADRISLAVSNAMLHREAAVAARRFDVLFEAHPQPMWIFDADTLRFLSVNDAAVRQYGYSADEFASMTIMELVPQQEPGAPIVPLERGDPRGGVALIRHQRKDGTILEMELMSHEVELDGQRGRLVIASDVGERTRALASLHHAEEQLRQAQRMDIVGRIGLGVAHDFNNVLTSIRGFGELLIQDLPESDPRRPGVERILHASDRGTLLARQLLAFGERPPPLHPRPVDVNALVREMEGLIGRLAGEDIKVETRLTEGLGAVQIDPARLEQAIVTLVLSARDAMPSGGTMTIETSERYVGGSPTGRYVSPGAYTVLAIGDTGNGLDPAPSRGAQDRRAGDDFGLQVVNSIVRQGAGLVRVTSEPGAGRTVKIYLPIGNPEKPATYAATAPSGSETVLVVEDEDGIRELVKRRLCEAGYRVLEASDGREALRVSDRHQGPIELLVSDVVMPGMSGRDLARSLSKSRPDLEVLYMSGYAQSEVQRRGVRRSDDSFLDKPFSGDELLRKARALLDRRTA